MDAHSELSSICERDAFCTFKIFPRIGKIAWNSELRAALVVPRADSPSTINNSVRFTSSERQSESFVGRDDDSSAFFRRCKSLWARAEIRVRDAPATFSRIKRPLALSMRRVVLKNSFILSATTAETIRVAAAVPRTSFVWPSNCGSDIRTVMTAVNPSRMSSLITSASLFFRVFVERSASLKALVIARSNPRTCVPPFGVAMMFTNERWVLSNPLPHFMAISTSISRSTSVETICPLSSRTGTVS